MQAFRVLCLTAIASTFSAAADFERDFSPARPDQTQGPTTLEPGHIQVEVGAWNFTRDKANGVTDQTWSFGETNVVFGVAKDFDFEVLIRPYAKDSQKGAASGDSEGFGDIDLLGRWNLWGNDGDGKTAGGLVSFVTVPTQTAVSSGQWEGGLIFTETWDFAEGWTLAGEVGLSRIWDDGAGKHEWNVPHTLEISHDLGKNGGVYVEYAAQAGEHAYQPTLGAGLSWNLTKNMGLDLGVAWGLSRSADDFSITQGFSFRF